jgi:uroporphyrinogen-III synthase
MMCSPDPAAPGVLITRPQPGAEATARRLRAWHFEPVMAPVLEIIGIPASLPPAEETQAVLVSSANALGALPLPYRARPLFAVGEATASRARAAGFADVRSAAGDGAALARLAIGCCDPAGPPLLLASGRDQGAPQAAPQRAAGFALAHHAVYAAEPVTSFAAPARAALAGHRLEAALFFSAASARHCAALIDAAGLRDATARVAALAISTATATALQHLPWRCVRVAAHPNQDALLALLRPRYRRGTAA